MLSSLKKIFSKTPGINSQHTQSEPDKESFEHDAFICYSRKNEAFAARLENMAETYKPPKDLDVPQKYLDLFLDKRDFATGDYYKNRDKHLLQSTKLVVICSPDARKSEYVNDEIKQFIQLRSPDDIIPILLAGIPNNEARSGQEEEMAFPDALYSVMKMPLGINYIGFDVKKDKINKGVFADSWFSLLAGIYNKSRAEVERREKRRTIRARRITYAILAGSTAILAVLLILVWISRNEAVNRKIAAEAAQFDALASQLFAESRRTDAQYDLETERLSQLREDFEIAELENVTAKDSLALRLTNLTQEISQTEHVLKTLEARSREYRKQGNDILTKADAKWSSLQKKKLSWMTSRSRPSMPALFSLELLNAEDEGKCMILHYGDVDNPKFIVVGGGKPPNYRKVLGPRLQKIKNQWSPGNPLPIEMIIAAEMDFQSTGGLIAMTDSLLSEQELNKTVSVNIGTIWYNSFYPQLEDWQKSHLSINARKLNIPLNAPFDFFIMRPDSAAVYINKGPLKITVINPDPRRIEKLGKLWVSLAENRMDTSFELKIPEEKFSNSALMITKATAAPLHDALFHRYKESSPINLASICLVFELNDKRILFTGDATGDDLLKGLHAAGYLSNKGTTHVDVMILPHSASDRNVSKEFFKRITADNYILFGDGTHDNPEVATLKMLEEARFSDSITMYFVNRDGRNNHGNRLDKYFLESNRSHQHRRVFRRTNDHSLLVNILDPVRF